MRKSIFTVLKLLLVSLLFLSCGGADTMTEESEGASKGDGGSGGEASNTKPQIVQSCSTEILVDTAYSCQANFSDPDSGQSHTWSLSTANSCAWAAINSDTGLISGTPSSLDVGSCTLVFEVSDGVESSNKVSLTITLSPLSFAQSAYLKAANPDSNDKFGNEVAVDGDLLAVVARLEDANESTILAGASASADDSAADSGAVYTFRYSGGSWSPDAYIKAPNNEASMQFGSGGVALSGDTLVVGAPLEDSNETNIYHDGGSIPNPTSAASTGAVYVFSRASGSWVFEAYIKAPNAGAGDQFGKSVAINGDSIVVGAPFEDSNQASVTNGGAITENDLGNTTGAAYVFTRTGQTWSFQSYLKPSNMDNGDKFGHKVAIIDDQVAVSAFEERSSQTIITNGSSASTDNSLADVGAVYVFERAGTDWSQTAYLKAPNAEGSDFFGTSLAMDSDLIVVGAEGEDSNQSTINNSNSASADNSLADSGAVYVFRKSFGNWVQEAYLKAPNPDASDEFGDQIAVSGDRILVGVLAESSNQTTIDNDGTASADNSAASSGAAYLYSRVGGAWKFNSYIKAPNAEAGDDFGKSVYLSGNRIVIGAPDEDSGDSTITNGSSASADNSIGNAGAVYVFEPN